MRKYSWSFLSFSYYTSISTNLYHLTSHHPIELSPTAKQQIATPTLTMYHKTCNETLEKKAPCALLSRLYFFTSSRQTHLSGQTRRKEEAGMATINQKYRVFISPLLLAIHHRDVHERIAPGGRKVLVAWGSRCVYIYEAFHVNCPSARRAKPKSCYF